MTGFRDEVVGLLKSKGYDKRCYPLEEFTKTFALNKKYADRKIFWYKWSGLFLLTAIPLISALLSVSVSATGGRFPWLPEALVFFISLALTLFTILNSIFKPSERFQAACRIGIGMNRFMIDFLVALEKMTTIDEAALLALIDRKLKELEKYQERLISMFMPIEIALQGESGSG